MKFEFYNGEQNFHTNVDLFEEPLATNGPIFVDYDSDRFRKVLNHFRRESKSAEISLRHDLYRLEDAIDCEIKEVNVGGEKIMMGISTFKRIPFLSCKANFEGLLNQDDREVDLDPVIFRKIISYLRNPFSCVLTDEMKVDMDFLSIEFPKESPKKSVTPPPPTWSQHDFMGDINFGKRVSCHLNYLNCEKIHHIIYLYLMIEDDIILESDQIISQIELNISGIQVNKFSGKIMRVNQILGLDPPVISWSHSSYKQEYLIPINLTGIQGGDQWIDCPLGDRIKITINFCFIDYADPTCINFHSRMEKVKLYVKSRKIIPKRLSKPPQYITFPMRTIEYTGKENFVENSRHQIRVYFTGEIDGFFISCQLDDNDDDNNNRSLATNLRGYLQMDAQRCKEFNGATNVLDQMTQFGSYHPEVFYIHFPINLSRVDQAIIVFEYIYYRSFIIDYWAYRKRTVYIKCDPEGQPNTIRNSKNQWH